ncbi:hypothetical protein T484DRAFT_3009176 [Baffinella frigidus]|nr:hypothetical protein T484DRAFT_3009176 [Cryptophyta sp. CCMP2293]
MAEMTGMLGGNDLMMLSSMLDETNLSEETAEKDRVKQLGPGDIGPPKKAPQEKPAKKKDPNAIWDEEEVGETSLLKDAKNTEKRQKPKYDMRYRQKITTDDALGAAWSVQDNSSMSCRELIIKVTMPDTKFSTVKLDENRKELLVLTSKPSTLNLQPSTLNLQP